MPKAKKYDVDIQGIALGILKREKAEWEQSLAFVTERVAFDMRNLVRQLRKNYWGVFDEPIDQSTGRKKIWIPFTESLVESVVKNIDLDTKDINYRAMYPKYAEFTPFVRAKVRSYLEDSFFGEDLDRLERDLAIDGTAVWKIMKVKENGRSIPKRVRVDLLNFYIDPTASSIQETPAVIERAIMNTNDLKTMDGWINTDVEGQTNLDKYDGDNRLQGTPSGETKQVEVFERWGLMPKSLITGNSKDTELIEGHIVASGIGGKSAVIHLIEENTTKAKFKNGEIKVVKPYEEAWYTRVSGRWYGKGIAEKVMMLQLWMNIIVNIRITRSYVSQIGLFKIKKGKGITPQALSRLPVSGAIQVQDQDDIQQFVIQEASQASYNDENSIQTWGQRVTSAFESVTGETMPSSTTATTSSIQAQSGASQFVLIKEGIGMFLDRVFKRHVLRILTLNKDDIIQIASDDQQELRDLDEKIAEYVLNKSMPEDESYIVPESSIMQARQTIGGMLKNFGNTRYFAIDKDIPLNEFCTVIDITNEKIDKGVVASNLQLALQAAPEHRDQILKALFDTLGVEVRLDNPQMQGQMPGQPQGQPQQAPISQNPQQIVESARTQ